MSAEEREVSLLQLGALAEERLKNGQQVRMTVVGNSMYPLFHNKQDSVLLSPAKGQIKRGTVAFYKRENGQYVLHRIIKQKGTVYSANGDNQIWIESPLYAEQILGVMTGFYRNGRYCSVNGVWYRLYSFAWKTGNPWRKQILWIYGHSVGKIRAWVRKREEK